MQLNEGSGSGYARHLSKYALAVLTIAALAYCSPHPAPALAVYTTDKPKVV